MNEISDTTSNDTVNISMASTCCRNCVFADFIEGVQVGCTADRLDKFSAAGVKIIKLENEEQNSTYFIIDGKTCVYYRNSEWIEDQYKNLSSDEVYNLITSELRIPYHVILFVRANHSLDQISTRLTELQNQKIPPKIVTLVDRSHTAEIKTGQFMKLFQNYNFDHWRIQSVQAIDQIDLDVVDLVYDSTKKMQYMFYMMLDCEFEIPFVLSEEIHTSLHDDMKSFVILHPNENNVGYSALKAAHAKYSGNSFGIPLEDKIIHYDDSTHLIKKVEEICPSLRVS
tara:strand:- start:942 stop:1793 length:852 start_codon:yes stop_codon:yes gene_type:complete